MSSLKKIYLIFQRLKIKKKLKRLFFFLSGQPLTPSPLLEAVLKKNFKGSRKKYF